ncbi:MAG: hypothetical protein IKR73_06260 [Oscillospiraceae bacterium]|nr:hypothetical protein [Oscillospiraceae bacterium]
MIYDMKDMCSFLGSRPTALTDKDRWLFVAVNTARSIIDNTAKDELPGMCVFADCTTVSQLQRKYDMIQGRYGREGFTQRKSPVYNYLSMLVAYFPDSDLTDDDRALIREYNTIDDYLLYELI